MDFYKFWKRIDQNTKKYGSDDTNFSWGKDMGSEKLNDK